MEESVGIIVEDRSRDRRDWFRARKRSGFHSLSAQKRPPIIVKNRSRKCKNFVRKQMSEFHSPSTKESAQMIVDDRSKGRRDWFGEIKRCEFHSIWSRRLLRSSSTTDLEKKDEWNSLTFDRQPSSDYCRGGINKTKKINWGKSSEFLSLAIAKLVHIILDARSRERKMDLEKQKWIPLTITWRECSGHCRWLV